MLTNCQTSRPEAEDLQLHLLVERESTPYCIDTDTPEFSWYLESEKPGCMQQSWRITVAAPDGRILWDSGRVESEEMSATYAGLSLEPETSYLLTLLVTDTLGQTAEVQQSFRTGVMGTDFEASMEGAKWIGTGHRSFDPDALSVFQLSVEFQIPAGSSQFSLIWGADDPRLMAAHQNLYGLARAPGESYVKLLLDQASNTLQIFRAGYTPEDDATVPIYSVSLPENGCPGGWHTLRIKEEYGVIDIFLDDNQCNHKPENGAPWEDGRINLNPVGQGGDFICYPNLCGFGVAAVPGQAVRVRNLMVRNYRKPENSPALYYPDETTLIGAADSTQTVIHPAPNGIPMLRREFELDAVEEAWLTITARGIYEVWINGQRVGDDYLTPGLTQYNKTHLYQVYPVSAYLHPGKNAIGILLGEGWWSGAITFTGGNWNFFGDVQSVIAKLTAVADGKRTTIVTDPLTWSGCNDGPIRYASLFQGQVYDAAFAAATQGWTMPEFQGQWPSAKEIRLSQENTAMGQLPGGRGTIQVQDYSQIHFCGQIGNSVKCVERLTAKTVTEIRPKVYIYDFGQNIAGIPEIYFPAGYQGRQITLRYAELLYPALDSYSSQQGMLMTENLRGALVTDKVTLGEKELIFCPRFTFHGFRYLEITGLDAPLPLGAVCARALSSAAHLTASYQCSDEKINRLYQNVLWSLRDNFLSIPTDCPQRNERMGWSGDLSVFSRTAVQLCDADAFLRRHMIAMRDMQNADGRFTDIAPVTDGFGGILWGSAGITVPWEAYQQYGDLNLLRTHYPAMVRYMDFLSAHLDPETGLQTAGELGDWLGPQNVQTETKLLWTAYYLYDLKIAAQAAELLGDPRASEFCASYETVQKAFCAAFLDPATGETVYSCEDAAYGNVMPFQPIDRSKPLPPKTASGRYRMDTQTSYCVPLALDVVPSSMRRPMEQNLIRVTAAQSLDDSGDLRPPYSLMTGFIGTAWILPALSNAGDSRGAYRMLRNDQYPSWLYPVNQGATTIWERLDSFTLDRGFGGHNSMNSFNHYSFGAVGHWMIAYSLGIQRGAPGFRHFVLHPTPDPDSVLTWAQGQCATDCGTVKSRWEITADGIEFRCTIPANSRCTMILPAAAPAQLQAEGPSALGSAFAQGSCTLELGPGSYRFLVCK